MPRKGISTWALIAAVLLSLSAYAQTSGDTEAEAEIRSALNAEPNFYFKHVNVTVKDRVAHLSGYVWTTDALVRAKQIAARARGVSRVDDELKLQRAGEHGPH